MKIITSLKLASIATLGFILGIVLFFPWQSIGDYVMSRGLAVAAENGIYATVEGCDAEGLIDKEFVYQSITADFPVFRFSPLEIPRARPENLRIFVSEYKFYYSFVTEQSLSVFSPP